MNLLIVNPTVSPGYLSDSFKKSGFKIIALYTIDLSKLQSYYALKPEWFDERLFMIGDKIETILEKLKAYDIKYVLNGNENSAHLTDLIAEAITPQLANDSKISQFRMNKYITHQQLNENNLAYIKQIKFTPGIDDLSAIKFANLKYPCFIKPLNGLGSYGVSKINSYKELCDFFGELNLDKLKSDLKVYMQDDTNLEYLICEYIEGDEYLVDTFSYQGKHYVSSIQRYYKKEINGVPTYRSWGVSKDELNNNAIIDYIQHVLDAVRLKNGFAHSEIFIDKVTHKPVLIELNPRVSGAHGMVNRLASLNNLPTQPELMQSILLNKKFKNTAVFSGTKSKQSFSNGVVLFNFSNKPLPELAAKLNKFNSVVEILQLKPVDYVWQVYPQAGADASAFVLCSNIDCNVLNEEVAQILIHDEKGWD